MSSKKSTKLVPATLEPHPRDSLGGFSVHHHQLGPIFAAEQVCRAVTDPTFRADLVRVESERGPGRARRPVKPVRNQLVGVLRAEASIEGVAATARRADHALRKRACEAAFAQGGAVPHAEAVHGRVLRQADRAAFQPGFGPFRGA